MLIQSVAYIQSIRKGIRIVSEGDWQHVCWQRFCPHVIVFISTVVIIVEFVIVVAVIACHYCLRDAGEWLQVNFVNHFVIEVIMFVVEDH